MTGRREFIFAKNGQKDTFWALTPKPYVVAKNFWGQTLTIWAWAIVWQ